MELPLPYRLQRLEPIVYPTFEEVENNYIKELVRKAGGNIYEAARISKLSRATIYRKMWLYGITKKWYLLK